MAYSESAPPRPRAWTLPAESWLPGAGLLGIAWCLWILIQGDRKVDPVYDRIAGTAILQV